MDKKELQLVLQEGEGLKIEFKESFGREANETVCAFANSKGGVLLVGVKDDGNIIGVPTGKNVLHEWINQIDNGTGVQPNVEKAKIKGKEVVIINVCESKIKPVMFHGRAYKRTGSSTRRMGVEELTRAVLESAGVTWDELPEPRATLAEIDTSKVKTFIKLANEVGRRPMPGKISARQLLEKLDLIKRGRLTRAAVLLFGKNPQKFYQQAIIKAGRFKSETLIVDDREIEGSLWEQVEGAMAYFRERLQTRFEMTGRPQREVIWEYPLEALREAVVNAICHRDYVEHGHTQVRIYDDRLMVWNPGGLPEELTVDMLKREHRSIPRNRLIAKVFFYLGLIEQWGSGSIKIFNAVKLSGLPEPVFEDRAGFRVTFQVASKVPEKVTERVPEKVTENQARILGEIKNNNSITAKDLSSIVGISERKIKENIKKLKKKGLLKRVGPDKGGYWKVAKLIYRGT